MVFDITQQSPDEFRNGLQWQAEKHIQTQFVCHREWHDSRRAAAALVSARSHQFKINPGVIALWQRRAQIRLQLFQFEARWNV